MKIRKAVTVYPIFKGMLMKIVYVNEEVCIGCHLCEVYCQLEHSASGDLVKAFRDRASLPLPLVQVAENKPLSFAVQCRHCAEPDCVYACLTGALSKDNDSGAVNVDVEKCIGCGTCILACPFGAIKRQPERGEVVKCDLCGGSEIPACVANCPNEALVCMELQNGSSSKENKAIATVQ